MIKYVYVTILVVKSLFQLIHLGNNLFIFFNTLTNFLQLSAASISEQLNKILVFQRLLSTSNYLSLSLSLSLTHTNFFLSIRSLSHSHTIIFYLSLSMSASLPSLSLSFSLTHTHTHTHTYRHIP